MSSVPCPTGDKGVCSIPSHTLVISDRDVAVRSRDQVEAQFPSLDLERVELVRADVHESMPDLAAALRAPEVDRAMLENFTTGPAAELGHFLRAQHGGAGAAVFVYCTPCGHIFKAAV